VSADVSRVNAPGATLLVERQAIVSGSRRRPSVIGISVLIIGAALTVTLSFVAHHLHQNNEHRLLDLQVKQTATVLQAALPGVETPLASAAQIAATSNGSVDAFDSYMKAYVGTPPKKPFAGATLYRFDGDTAHRITSVGITTSLSGGPAQVSDTLRSAGASGSVSLLGPFAVNGPHPRLGYVYAVRRTATYVVYAESLLPRHRFAPTQPGSPFADLRFALYRGASDTKAGLVETNSTQLPVPGDTAMVTVPFGGSQLTLVASATTDLSGGLSKSFWWIVALVGTVITLLSAATADRLARRRTAAEQLTAQTQVQLAEQRSIASVLQQAMLPETLPTIDGLRIQASYLPGATGVDIGGDWYDILPLDSHRVFFVIGDVSGRGLAAGTTMAALRFAVHAFVSEGHSPGVVLDRLAALLSVERDRQFATILCGVFDVPRRTMTIANAGHLPPLLVADGVRFIDVDAGPPIGVPHSGSYATVTVPVPDEAVLIAFTDGLVERRGEALDVGLERLRSAIEPRSTVDEVFVRIVPDFAADSSDDIAIVGVQWPG
jgi:type II secretory pathway pseudopilin PulG